MISKIKWTSERAVKWQVYSYTTISAIIIFCIVYRFYQKDVITLFQSIQLFFAGILISWFIFLITIIIISFIFLPKVSLCKENFSIEKPELCPSCNKLGLFISGFHHLHLKNAEHVWITFWKCSCCGNHYEKTKNTALKLCPSRKNIDNKDDIPNATIYDSKRLNKINIYQPQTRFPYIIEHEQYDENNKMWMKTHIFSFNQEYKNLNEAINVCKKHITWLIDLPATKNVDELKVQQKDSPHQP